MKMSEIRGLSNEELEQQLSDQVDAHFKLRVRSATERIEDTARFPNLRRGIAQLKTVLRERQLQGKTKERG